MALATVLVADVARLQGTTEPHRFQTAPLWGELIKALEVPEA